MKTPETVTQVTIDGTTETAVTNRKQKRRQRRGPPELALAMLRRMTPDDLFGLGVAFAKSAPMSAELLERGLTAGRVEDLREQGDTRTLTLD